jgi:hypothetical protein
LEGEQFPLPDVFQKSFLCLSLSHTHTQLLLSNVTTASIEVTSKDNRNPKMYDSLAAHFATQC